MLRQYPDDPAQPGQSVSHVAVFELPGGVERIFELFTPEGETRWAPGWSYRNVTGAEALHEDFVFLTRDHDHAAAEAVWIVKRYDPEAHAVEYYKVEPGEKVGVVAIRCTERGTGTEVKVGYRYIALSARGRTFTESFTAGVFKAYMDEWQRLLRAYLEQRA